MSTRSCDWPMDGGGRCGELWGHDGPHNVWPTQQRSVPSKDGSFTAKVVAGNAMYLTTTDAPAPTFQRKQMTFDVPEAVEVVIGERWRLTRIGPECIGDECLTNTTRSGHLPECPIERGAAET